MLEVLVALGLLALGLTLLLGALSQSTSQVRWSAEAGRAALHAQSLLDTLEVGVPLEPGQRQGTFEDGHYRWTLALRPWHDPQLPPPATTPAQPTTRLLELELQVDWGDAGPRQRLTVHSLRLVPAWSEATP